MTIDYDALPIADTWYGIEPYLDGILRIREASIDPYWSGTTWLVRGSKSDLVIDCGTGIVPLAPLIGSITSRPFMTVCLCRYFDHAGGFYSFEQRACHPLEAAELSNPSISELTAFLGKENRLRALPAADFRLENYRIPGAAPTRLLKDSEIIDLGNRKFEVLHIPGRTPGSLALWEARTGYLFGGETLFVDPENRDFPPENSADYEASLQRLSKLPATRIFGGHYASFSAQQLEHLVAAEIGRYH